MALNKIEAAHQMYRDGHHEMALRFYTDALAMAKAQKIALHSNRAACYLKLQDFRKAAEECTLVLELDQKHTGALMLRAQTLVTLREYQSALFDVNRLLELNPSSEVYQNLRARLKTQLLLAPIPECEEESLVDEVEDDYDGHEQCDGDDDDEYSHDWGVNMKKIEENGHPAVAFASKDLKIEKNNNSEPDAPLPDSKDSQDIQSKGWEAIPKPRGHSNLDYSRWDSVEDDSSQDEEEDDDEDSQPQYRFRVRTVGVRTVK